MRFLHVFAAVVWLTAISSVPAMAEGNIHAGQLKINPFLTVNEEFSDNIYYTSGDQKHDSITTYTPGVKFTLPFSIHQADLEFDSVLARYSQHSAENTDDYHANGDVDLHIGSLFGLKLSDQYASGHEPRSSSSTGFIEKYKTNTATASATYQLAGLSKIQIDFAPTTWRFKTSEFRNRDESLVSAYFFYRFLPKTSVFIEYDHKTVDFIPETTPYDSKSDDVQLGLTWEISARSKGTLKAGYIKKDFKTSATDYSGVTAYADIRHDFTDNTSIFVNGQRVVNESNVFGSRYFITTGAYAEVSHKLVRRLSGVVRGSYGEDAYPDIVALDTTARIDRTTMAGAGLKYALKEWCEFAVDFNNRHRLSNLTVNAYHENSTIITASLSF